MYRFETNKEGAVGLSRSVTVTESQSQRSSPPPPKRKEKHTIQSIIIEPNLLFSQKRTIHPGLVNNENRLDSARKRKIKMTKKDQDLFDYDELTLVDKPDSPRNAGLLPQTVSHQRCRFRRAQKGSHPLNIIMCIIMVYLIRIAARRMRRISSRTPPAWSQCGFAKSSHHFRHDQHFGGP